MNFSSILAGGALVGIFTGIMTTCWSYIKEFSWKIINSFVDQVELAGISHTLVLGYFLEKFKKSPLYSKNYRCEREWQKPEVDGDPHFYGYVPYEDLKTAKLVFWNGWIPFYVCPGDNPSPYGDNKVQITFIRGTLNLDKILQEVFQQRNKELFSHLYKQKSKKFTIFHIPDDTAPPVKTGSDNTNANANTAKTPKVAPGGNSEVLSSTGGIQWYANNSNRLLCHKPDELGLPPGDGNALQHLLFPPHITKLQEEIKIWINNRKWYSKHGVPWKRGWLLYGPPGTGKTAMVRAFAKDFDLPIFVFNLAKIWNDEFAREWRNMQLSVPCIALIEDFDNIFHGRTNISRMKISQKAVQARLDHNKNLQENQFKASVPNAMTETDQLGPGIEELMTGGGGYGLLSFDTLLNCLDGIESSEGIFTIITTNDISKVDAALGQPQQRADGTIEFISTRPGRIDKVIELSYMRQEDKKKMGYRLLARWEDKYREFLRYLDENPDANETPAQIQERCSQMALQAFWEESNEKIEEKVVQYEQEIAIPLMTVNGKH